MSLLVTQKSAPKRLTALLLALVPWVGFAASPSFTINNSGWSVPPSINSSPANVTVLQLLVNPLPYGERYITVRGVLSVEPEDNRLYMSKEFFDAFFPEYAIQIRLPAGAAAASAKYLGKYVTLRGTFSLENTPFSRGVLHVTSLQVDDQGRRVKPR